MAKRAPVSPGSDPREGQGEVVHVWNGDGLDPILHLFSLDTICRKSRIQSTRWITPERLGLGKHATEAGVFPVCYRQGSHNLTPLHTHDFFEILVVLEGKGEYRTGKGPLPLKARDFIYVDNREPHCLQGVGEGMQVLNICFLPSAVGYDDASLTDPNLLNYYPLLSPFRVHGKDGWPFRLSFEDTTFRRILVDGLQLVEIYQVRGAGGRDRLRPRLKTFLQTVQDVFEKVKPSDPSGVLGVQAVLDYCEEHQARKVTLTDMAVHFGMNATYLSTLINKRFGYGFPKVLNGFRIEKAKGLLVETSLPVSRIALEVGYVNVSHFNAVFAAQVGCSPGEYRAGGRGLPKTK